MRDPNRIPEILKELEKYWTAAPDLRLGQLINNLSYLARGYHDMFCTEDEEMVKVLKNLNQEISNKKENEK